MTGWGGSRSDSCLQIGWFYQLAPYIFSLWVKPAADILSCKLHDWQEEGVACTQTSPSHSISICLFGREVLDIVSLSFSRLTLLPLNWFIRGVRSHTQPRKETHRSAAVLWAATSVGVKYRWRSSMTDLNKTQQKGLNMQYGPAGDNTSAFKQK